MDIGFDPPSSLFGGEAFLQRIYDAYRSMTSPSGTNVWNTALLVGWDEPGGTYDHVAPGPVPPPDPAAPAGELGFTFDRSGYRVPAIMVSPWVAPGSVYNEEHRHTSLIATLRKVWNLGDAFTQRDASARTFDHVFSLDRPRQPEDWVAVEAQPVPAWTLDVGGAAGALSTLGKVIGPGLIDAAKKMGVPLPAELDGPDADFTPELLIKFLRQICWHFFPQLEPSSETV
jgi:phospholipase C